MKTCVAGLKCFCKGFLKESEFLLGELGSVLRRDVAQRDTELVLFVFSRQLDVQARKQMGVHVRAATNVHHQSGYFYSKREKKGQKKSHFVDKLNSLKIFAQKSPINIARLIDYHIFDSFLMT